MQAGTPEDSIKAAIREQLELIETELERDGSSWEFILMIDLMRGLTDAALTDSVSRPTGS